MKGRISKDEIFKKLKKKHDGQTRRFVLTRGQLQVSQRILLIHEGILM